jgi:hypothetical protein
LDKPITISPLEAVLVACPKTGKDTEERESLPDQI